MNRVGFGFLGTTLDAYGGFGEKRHTTWRPSVSLGLDPTLQLSRFELWYGPRYEKLAKLIQADIEAQKGAKVILREAVIRDPWNFEEVYSFLYDFSISYPFKIEEEEYFVHLTTGTHVAQICLFLLTETRAFPAKLVQTNPRKKQSQEAVAIIDLDLSKYDKLASRFEKKIKDDIAVLKTGINTRNSAFNRLITEIEVVARSSSEPILLLGPTGAGKSQLAKQIFLLKQSKYQLKGEFVDLNCATVRGDQATSTLFGHAKGAFTGALSKRDGLLKKADGGLLFLDEIGELGLDEQAMLLRALEEKRFFPLGSDVEESSDFQLISGTNRDLQDRVRANAFRDDLFQRINLWSFALPALKDRKEDIEPNLQFELAKYESRTGRRITFNSEARALYLQFAISPQATWRGNFRDLNASLIRMATLSQQGRITADLVAAEISRLQALWGDSVDSEPANFDVEEVIRNAGGIPQVIDPFDRPQLANVIRTLRSSDSLAEAGRALFSVSRRGRETVNDSDRVRKYLNRFGIDARKLTKVG